MYTSALIGSDNINIEILSFDDEGYVFVDYSYNGKTIHAYVPESCICLMASEFSYWRKLCISTCLRIRNRYILAFD